MTTDHLYNWEAEAEFLNTRMELPDWAYRKAQEGELTFMQQAFTKDGSRNGNGVIAGICLKRNEIHISVITETGNIIDYLTKKEFDDLFTPGRFILKEWPTTESRKSWMHWSQVVYPFGRMEYE